MKKNVKSLIILLLAVLLLQSMFACGSEGNPRESGDLSSTVVTETEKPPDTVGPDHNVPENLDLDMDVKVLIRTEFKSEFVPQEDTADVLSAAILSRNYLAEEYLGVRFNFQDRMCDEYIGYYGNSPFHALVTSLMRSGDDEFQLIAGFGYFSPAYILQGYFVDLNSVTDSYLSPEKIWWNGNYWDEASLNGKNYFLLGDICTTELMGCEAIYYNEELAKSYLGEDTDLLKTVYDREWTYDFFLEAMAQVGAGEEAGMWGLSALNNASSIDGFMIGLGLNLIKKGDTAESFDVVVTNPHNFELTDALRELYHGSPYATASGIEATNAFAKGQALFYAGSLEEAAKTFRHEKLTYGILPFPLWNADQKEYRVSSHDFYTVLGIPYTAKDPQALTAVLEVMAAESYKKVRPALHDVCFKFRYLDSPEKAAMFDYIVSRIHYDFGFIYSDVLKAPNTILGPVHIFRYNIALNESDLVNKVYGNAGIYRSNLKKLVRKFYAE